MTMRSGERNSAGLVARSTRHRFRLRSGVALLALVLHGGACAVATYPGPRRPSSEVALVEARDLAIDEIDGLDVRGKGARFEVLAGDHMMVVHLAKVTRFGPGLPVGSGLVLAGVVTRSGQIPLCVSARPRHSYMLEPKDAGVLWQPVVFDGSPDVRVPSCGPVAAYHRDDFPCQGPLEETSLASGVRKVTGCGIENVYGYEVEANQWKSVTERAMFDMNCPGQALTVHHLGSTAVSVVGCGMRADYVANTPCTDGLCAFKDWVPNVAAAR